MFLDGVSRVGSTDGYNNILLSIHVCTCQCESVRGGGKGGWGGGGGGGGLRGVTSRYR